MPSLRRKSVRSVTRFRNSRSWLTISMGTGNSTVSQRSSVSMLARSRWLVGSSRIRMSGSSSRAAAAISSRRCQPPDSVPKGRRGSPARHRSRPATRRCANSRRPGQPSRASDAARRGPAKSARPPARPAVRCRTRSPRERITLPPFSSSSPVRHFSRVDLPVPFSPTSAVRASSSRKVTPPKTRSEP